MEYFKNELTGEIIDWFRLDELDYYESHHDQRTVHLYHELTEEEYARLAFDEDGNPYLKGE